jgi:hypothetical protein
MHPPLPRQVLLSHRYAVFETPTVHTNVWPGPSPGVSNASLSAHFCNNAAYNWGLDFTPLEFTRAGGLTMGPNISCLPFDSTRHVVIGDSSFTAITYMRITPVLPDPNPAGTAVTVTDARVGNVTLWKGSGGAYHA